MKIYPKLERFLNNLAIAAMTEPGFAEICEAAEINWAWPKNFAGDAVAEYRDDLRLLGAERAQSKHRSVISLLLAQAVDLSAMPTTIEDVNAEYRELCKVQAAIDAANAILSEPAAYAKILNTLGGRSPREVVTLDYAGLVNHYAGVLETMKAEGPMLVIPGFEGLSELVGGFNHSRITLVMAQSGFGKSNLGMKLGFSAADKVAVVYMNLEMGFDDVSKRTSVIRSRRSWAELNSCKIAPDEFRAAPRHEFRITNGREMHIDSIIAYARAFKRTNPDFGFLIVDYDQKIQVNTTRDMPEWKAVHQAIKALEELAKEIQLHVIVIAQFNRQGEIASSWRVINSAHTVLKFREHNGGVVIENSIKSRYAKYPCAVYVDYDKAKADVREQAPGGVVDFVEEREPKENPEKAVKFKSMTNRFERFSPGNS